MLGLGGGRPFSLEFIGFVFTELWNFDFVLIYSLQCPDLVLKYSLKCPDLVLKCSLQCHIWLVSFLITCCMCYFRCQFVHEFAGILAVVPTESLVHPKHHHATITEHLDRLLNKKLIAVIEDKVKLFTEPERAVWNQLYQIYLWWYWWKFSSIVKVIFLKKCV